jgi:hypothetical protein
MKIYHKLLSEIEGERGVSAVIVAIVLTLLIGLAALAIDVGYLYATKNELQDVADAAALAGAGLLGEIYGNYIPSGDAGSYNVATLNYYTDDAESYDYKSIENIAAEVALKNKAGGVNITIQTGTSFNGGDIIIGKWPEGGPIDPTQYSPDAVEVTVRRDAGLNGKVATFFARILWSEFDSVTITATATAALRGKLEAAPGELELPIGVSRHWENLHDNGAGGCGEEIAFSPTTNPDACAGWNIWDNSPASDIRERYILANMNETVPDSDWDSPQTTSGVTEFNFINGDLSKNTFLNLMTLFQIKGYDVKIDGENEWAPILDENGEPVNYATEAQGAIVLYDDDGITPLYYPDFVEGQLVDGNTIERHRHAWQTTVVIYDSDDCAPSGDIKIIGFMRIELREVGGPSDKTVKGVVLCDQYTISHGGGSGGSLGVKGTIPHLVK